jgi:hypothetical protein
MDDRGRPQFRKIFINKLDEDGQKRGDLETGDACNKNTECMTGLCCAEGLLKEDIVDG